MRGTRCAVVAAVMVAGALTACSDTGRNPSAPSPDRNTTMAPAERAGSVTVEIPGFRFDPDPLRVKVGTAVVWHNGHDQAHTSTGAGTKRWNTQNIAPGATSAPVTFDEPGTYPYFCALHPFMKGTVEVGR